MNDDPRENGAARNAAQEREDTISELVERRRTRRLLRIAFLKGLVGAVAAAIPSLMAWLIAWVLTTKAVDF